MGHNLTLPVPFFDVITKELKVVGSFRYGPGDYPLAISLVERGLIDLKPLVTQRYEFKDALEAFETTRAGKDPQGKVSKETGAKLTFSPSSSALSTRRHERGERALQVILFPSYQKRFRSVMLVRGLPVMHHQPSCISHGYVTPQCSPVTVSVPRLWTVVGTYA
jgi:hypothetical protein